MFVRYFVELPFALSLVEDALLREPKEWIPGLAERAEQYGEDLLGEVSTGGRLHKKVIIDLQNPVRFPSRTVLPMTWRAASQQGLFPVLDADLEVAGLGSGVTQLSVSARYRPPMGVVGKAIDKAFLHRVAEATIKDFVDHVGAQLEILVASSPAPSPAPKD